MAIYSIRDLEKLTGIKAHTIRIWEQRYSIIVPARTETNIRYYTDDNLRHLFNVALLNRHGHKISHLAQMPPEAIAAKVAEIAAANGEQNTQIDALMLAMIDFDEAGFERIVAAYVWEKGFERAMLELVYPFLDKLNVFWLTQSISPAHEKFIGSLIRRKLMSAIDQHPSNPGREAPSFVLYTPESESQELTLLFIQYLLRSRNYKVVYLGANTTLNDLKDVSEALKPQFVYTILQEPLSRQTIQNYVDMASKSINGSVMLLTGAQLFVNPVRLPDNAVLLNGLQDTVQFLDKIQIGQINGKSGIHS